MHWSDRLEKVGRAVLWLTLALMFVMVPLAMLRYQFALAEDKAEATKVQEKLTADLAQQKADNGPKRLLLTSMGSVMRSLNFSTAEGRMYFTNVSSRSGVVCVAGVATNTASQETSESLPTCEAVAAYSAVEIKVMFAGATLGQLCPKAADCRMSLVDVPDRVP